VFAIKGAEVDYRIKLTCCLIPNVALSFGVYNLFQFEVNRDGLTMESANLWFENTTFTNSIVMLLFDLIWMTVAGIYFDQVIKSDYG